MTAPGTIPPSFAVLKNRAILPDPFVWALEITGPNGEELFSPDGEQNAAVRLTAHSAPFRWGTTTSGAPKEWWSIGMGIQPIRQSGDASLHTIAVTLSNAFGLSQLWLAQNDNFIDHRASLYILNLSTLNDPEAFFEYPGRITGASASLAQVSLSVTAGGFGFAIPKNLVTTNCRFVYRGDQCGFALDPDGRLLGPCNKTLPACEVRGDLEEAEGATVNHPRRFGGFPGIPRGSSTST